MVTKKSTKPKPQDPKPEQPSLESIIQDLNSLKQIIQDHTNQITQLQETLARKRKPVTSNGKVQIKDKLTGTVYPSKNNAYKSLLKTGELKDLVDKGVFGPVPERNTFGWYVLVREWPDRFEEVAKAQNKE
jgi:hypothetical protein